MLKSTRLLAEYIGEVWKQWQAIVGGAAVTLLLWLVGERLPDLFSHILAILGLSRFRFFAGCVLLVLLCAQFLAWKDAKGKIADETKKLTEQLRLNQQTALVAELDLRFGPNSNFTPARRFELAKEYFEGLEAEVLSGNFTNAGKVLALKDIMLSVLRGYFGGGAGYPAWHDRLFKVVDLVSAHLKAQG